MTRETIYVEFEASLENETPKAYLFKFESGKELWIPKSVSRQTTELDVYEVAEWWLKKNNMSEGDLA